MLASHQVLELAGREHAADENTVGARVHERGDGGGPGAVALEEQLAPHRVEARQVPTQPVTTSLGRGRVVRSSADRHAHRRAGARASDHLEGAVGKLGAQRAERRPLAADEAQHGRPVLGLVERHVVVAGDEPRRQVAVARKRTDAGVAEDDVGAIHRDAGEHVPDQVEEVVDLLLGAHGALPRIRLDVGGADEHAALERVDQHDAPVRVLEEDLVAVGGGEQLRIVEHDVRALGAAHQLGRAPEGAVGQVGPRPRGVHDDVGGDRELLAGLVVAQPHAVGLHADRLDVIDGVGALVRGEAVEQHVEREPLRVVHRGVVVARGVLDAGVEFRERRTGGVPAEELVARHAAAVAGEQIVDHHPDLDERGPAFLRATGAVTQEAQRRREDAREGREDRDRGLQRPHEVRRDLQQRVALLH